MNGPDVLSAFPPPRRPQSWLSGYWATTCNNITYNSFKSNQYQHVCVRFLSGLPPQNKPCRDDPSMTRHGTAALPIQSAAGAELLQTKIPLV